MRSSQHTEDIDSVGLYDGGNSGRSENMATRIGGLIFVQSDAGNYQIPFNPQLETRRLDPSAKQE